MGQAGGFEALLAFALTAMGQYEETSRRIDSVALPSEEDEGLIL
jgi:hypothetical protein